MSTSNTAFTWPETFNCSLVKNNSIYPNQYTISVSMIAEVIDDDAIRLGFKKVKHFINHYIKNSILIKYDNPLLTKLNSIETNTIQLPEEPHDFIFASVLFHKFSAILENTITITEITIDSSIGDRVKYTVNAGKQTLGGNFWWNFDSPETNDIDVFPSWNDVIIHNKFEPKIVLGGINGNRSVR